MPEDTTNNKTTKFYSSKNGEGSSSSSKKSSSKSKTIKGSHPRKSTTRPGLEDSGIEKRPVKMSSSDFAKQPPKKNNKDDTDIELGGGDGVELTYKTAAASNATRTSTVRTSTATSTVSSSQQRRKTNKRRSSTLEEFLKEASEKGNLVPTCRYLSRLLRADLISNICLAIGGTMFTTFFVRDLQKSGRDTIADALYFTGSMTFLISGCIQIMIDMCWVRSIRAGRYTTSKAWNLIISTLFVWGVICDMIAFFYWRIGTPESIRNERITQWVGSHLWLIAAVIVIFTNLQKSDQLEDKIDVVANVFFLLESTMNVVARYVTDTSPSEDEMWDPTEIRLELAAAIFWTCNALFYLAGGSIRMRKFRQGYLT